MVENQFLQEVQTIIKANLSDAQFQVPELAAACQLGRTQLFRKLKAISNQSPADVLRTARLQHANNLLQTTQLTIAEITYQSGFKSAAHFAKLYKKYFGKTPSEVRKS